jgi:hypothetical protein
MADPLLLGLPMRLGAVLGFGVPAIGIAVLLGAGVQKSNSAPPVDEAARHRCASRLSLAITGQAPDATLLASPDPQSQVDTLLASPAFVEQFSRYMNSELNNEPGETPQRDSTYYLTRHILQNNRPWHELFDGPYDVVADATVGARVEDNAAGLGYFRSRPWMLRYAGNEERGYRLVAAYRIMQNTIGLNVAAVTNAPGVDVSATGRLASGCKGCHYDPYFALDKVAKILSRKTGPADNPTFTAPTEGPQQILGNQTIANDKELVKALVESTDFKFRQCRLVFQYLMGRPEANCEAPLFDKCIDALTSTGDMRAALKTVAQDPAYCE